MTSPLRPTPAVSRVAFVAGGLSQGGAEKQLVYMVRALRARGVDVRVYCLTRGDFHERALVDLGVPPVWIGQHGAPPLRVIRLARELRAFRPQVVQAAHFFASLYAVLGAHACGALSIGAIRNDGAFELKENGRWGPWLLKTPDVLIANSHVGARFAREHGRSPSKPTVVVPNVIDLDAFDAVTTDLNLRDQPGPLVMAVGRLVRAKRFERFLQALATVRRVVPTVHGVIVGEGPERAGLEAEAQRLGLGPDALRLIGARSDVPALLRQADCLVACSDHEGFPNVILEAMAARVSVVTMPAGDAGAVVLDGITGYVVPADDVVALTSRLETLARSDAERRALGDAGRAEVERAYREGALADRLFAVYVDGLRAMRPGVRREAAAANVAGGSSAAVTGKTVAR